MAQDFYSMDFTPPVRVGENLKLVKNAAELLGYGTVKYIEPLPFKVHNFGAIATEASTSDQEVTDLYMKDGELAIYQMIPLDDEEITVSQPKAQKRYATKDYVHIITPFIQQISPLHTRVAVWEDEKIFFDVKNPTKYNRLIHRVLYHGWRVILGELSKTPPQAPATVVPVEGA